jgi:hypothetical protein
MLKEEEGETRGWEYLFRGPNVPGRSRSYSDILVDIDETGKKVQLQLFIANLGYLDIAPVAWAQRQQARHPLLKGHRCSKLQKASNNCPIFEIYEVT